MLRLRPRITSAATLEDPLPGAAIGAIAMSRSCNADKAYIATRPRDSEAVCGNEAS
jgi:hypothetical protein